MTTKAITKPDRKPPRTAKPTADDVAIFKNIDEEIPRESLAAVLSRTADSRAEILFNMMMNPLDKIQAKMPLHQLARLADITWNELVDFIRNDYLLKGILRVAVEVPKVMSQTAYDAQSRTETCAACNGDGEQVVGKKMVICSTCQGRGERYIKGDIDNRKIIWESTGLIGKKAAFNQQINIGTAHPSASFEAMVHRGRDAIEAPDATPQEDK